VRFALSSTIFPPQDWPFLDARYHKASEFYRLEFGCKVWRISVDVGFGCPNVDGSIGTGDCRFCNTNSFMSSSNRSDRSLEDQIESGIKYIGKNRKVSSFVAYFQSATNTYDMVPRLRALYELAIACPGVLGLIIATRPDTVSDEVLDLLEEIAERTWLTVEYGLQTIHNRSLEWLKRGHDVGCFYDAVERSRKRQLRIGAHVILGLPGETRQDMIDTAKELARLSIDSVKIHNLHVVRDTALAEDLREGRVVLQERSEYVECVVDFLEELPTSCVIDRLSGDAPRKYLIAPMWCLKKQHVLRAVECELERRDTWQGRKCSG